MQKILFKHRKYNIAPHKTWANIGQNPAFHEGRVSASRTFSVFPVELNTAPGEGLTIDLW